MRILTLDDEISALQLLMEIVEKVAPEAELYGFQDPEAALKWAENNTPIDVVFLDAKLRDTTGLTVAKRLKKICPKVNLIFTTGYCEYAVDACNLHSSGYILKPMNETKVRNALDNLLFPTKDDCTKIYIRTFGSFEVFVNDEIVHFNRSKSKEMLAYLVDRHGSSVSRKEIFAILFGDESYTHGKQAYLTNIIRDLQRCLAAVGISKVLIRRYNTYAIAPKTFTCDLYEYEKGSIPAINQFHGEYMLQYSWGENTLASLYY